MEKGGVILNKFCDELGVGNVAEIVRAYYNTHGCPRNICLMSIPSNRSNWLVFNSYIRFTK